MATESGKNEDKVDNASVKQDEVKKEESVASAISAAKRSALQAAALEEGGNQLLITFRNSG